MPNAVTKCLVVDGNSLFAKGFYASVGNDELSREQDGWLKAIFMQLFSSLRTIGHLDYVLFCFDGKSKTNKPRVPKPEKYESSLKEFKLLIQDAFGMECYAWHPDYESDDLVATAAHQAVATGHKVVVMSGDKDLKQLHDGKSIYYYCLVKKRFLSSKEICERWLINKPSEVAIALAIIGDPADGINGVTKMAARAVQKLFQNFHRDLPLPEVCDRILEKLKPSQQIEFLESLNFTLLNTALDLDLSAGKFNPLSKLDRPESEATWEYENSIRRLKGRASDDEIDDWDL